MEILKKSKTSDMQRLRAAGFSLANADRLSQNRRGGALILIGAGAVGLLLVGGIAALSLHSSPAEPRITAQNEQPKPVVVASVTPAELPLEKAVSAAILKAEVERKEAAIVATLARTTAASITPTATKIANPEVTVSAEAPDCVAQLGSYLETRFVKFGVGATFITDQSDVTLADIGRKIAGCSDAYVMVSGHSDSTGNDADNITLSWARADKTVERLLAYGVEATSLEAVGFGARAPLSQGSTSDDPINRRVEFRVLRKKDPA